MSATHRYFIVTCLTTIAAACLIAGPAAAQDANDLVRTSEGSSVGVEVVGMTPLAVTISEGNRGTREVPVNEIRAVLFGGEPTELTRARVHVQNSGYRDAQDMLERISVAGLERDYIRQDIEFYKAFAAAKLALAGDGSVNTAGQQLHRFVTDYPQSFHYLAAAEVLGDLLVANERYADAQTAYGKLAATPWPEYKARSAMLIGQSLQAEGKHAEAIARLDAAVQLVGTGEAADAMRLSATLGKAVSLAETGQLDQAVSAIEAVIRSADPEDAELHARAYNALGACYEKAGRQKDALLAYLHVEVVYSRVREAYIEALRRMIPLWEALGENEQAQRTRQALAEYSPRAATNQ